MPSAESAQLTFESQSISAKFIDPSGKIVELRIVLMVRSNYAPWVRSDHTGFEVMLGDMTTFVAPEQTAKWACLFFS